MKNLRRKSSESVESFRFFFCGKTTSSATDSTVVLSGVVSSISDLPPGETLPSDKFSNIINFDKSTIPGKKTRKAYSKFVLFVFGV